MVEERNTRKEQRARNEAKNEINTIFLKERNPNQFTIKIKYIIFLLHHFLKVLAKTQPENIIKNT